MYTPEEFANKLKLRGIVPRVADARKYVKGTGKTEFDEPDFEEAYYATQAKPVGRAVLRENFGEYYVYYEKDKRGIYWAKNTSEI